MRIVVFGAGGFVGGWICEELAQRNDVELVACVRKWASAVRLARRGIELRQADLEDVDQLATILTGADVVINAAMPLPAREPELVAALYLGCAKASVRRFVQFSSAAVYGNATGHLAENTLPAPVDDYSRGKAEMERRLSEAAATTDLPVVILRPSIIYGPFSEAWTVRYVQRIVNGRWRALGRLGDGTCNLVYAHDVASAAIVAALAEVSSGVHVLNINGPDVVTWNEYIERLGDALGTTDRKVPSAAIFQTIAIGAELLRRGAQVDVVRSFYRRSVGTTRSAMKGAQDVTKLYPSSGELSLLGRKVHYAAGQAAHVIGFTPSVSLNEGLRRSVSWCRIHGIV